MNSDEGTQARKKKKNRLRRAKKKRTGRDRRAKMKEEKKARSWERQGDVISNSKRLSSSGRNEGRREELLSGWTFSTHFAEEIIGWVKTLNPAITINTLLLFGV